LNALLFHEYLGRQKGGQVVWLISSCTDKPRRRESWESRKNREHESV